MEHKKKCLLFDRFIGTYNNNKALNVLPVHSKTAYSAVEV